MTFSLKSMRTKYKDFKYSGKRQSRDGFASSLLGGLTTQNNFIGQLVKVPAKYYLEMRNGDEIIAVMSFPYDPDAVSYIRPQPTNITYTLGGVIRETNTIRRHNITLTGSSGLATRTAYTRSGALFYSEGEEVFQEFDEFLKYYTEVCAAEFGLPSNMMASDLIQNDINFRQALGTGTNSIHLVLRCIDEDIHLKVEPAEFRWEKNSGANRFDYRWICSFIGYDYASKYTNVFFQALDFVDRQVSSAGGIIGGINNSISTISNDYVGRVRKSIQKVSATYNVVSETIEASSGLLSNVVGVASDFVSLKDDLSYIVEDFKDLQNVFAQGTSAAESRLLPDASVIGQGASALKTTQIVANNASEPLLRVSDVSDDEYIIIQSQLTSLRNEMEILRGQIPLEYYNNRQLNISNPRAEVIAGSFLGNESNYSFLTKGVKESNITDDVSNKNYFIHYLQKNEDLYSLAQKYLGDIGQWKQLMFINKWRDARRTPDGHLAEIGTKLFIPLPSQSVTNPFGKKDDFIGVDLRMELNDISLSDGDIVLSNGEENIKQFIKSTLLTSAGELIGFNSFGLPSLPQVSDLIYGGVLVREALIKDPRIIDVTNIELSIENDTLIIECDVLTKNSTKINIKTSL